MTTTGTYRDAAPAGPQGRPGSPCVRCGRTQPGPPAAGRPPAGRAATCVYCGYPLPLTRWIAHPPPGGVEATRRLRRRPYPGPPSYGGRPPGWGFPAIAWRRATVDDRATGRPTSTRLLRAAGWLAVVTAVACVLAAGAETWRWVLLLRGRTEVLSAQLVAASDLLVGVAAAAAGALALSCALIAVPQLVRAHAEAERRAGFAPSRTAAAVVARLIVPGWNLFGAGQVLAEIDGRLLQCRAGRAGDPVRPRPGRLVTCWWWAWFGNGVLVLVTLARAFGGSLQAVADTVELHIAVDLSACLVAALSAAVFFRFARLLDARGGLPDGWVVAPPAPTRAVRSAG